MPKSVFDRLADVALFVESAEESPDVASALAGGGADTAHVSAGAELLERGLETVLDVAAEYATDTTIVHLVHTASTEVEMWLQSIARKVRQATSDDERRTFLLGKHLHLDDHSLSVMVQAKRVLGTMRTAPEWLDAFGSEKALADQYQRGTTLLARLVKMADTQVTSEARRSDAPVLPGLIAQLDAWLDRTRGAAGKGFADNGELYGAVGHRAEGIGLTFGGTALSVVKHERAIFEPPSAPSKPGPGWGQGRQGRNRENLGRGF